jgi:hypothetical protein
MQFLFLIVFNQSPNTHRFETEAWAFGVDVDQQRSHSPFCRCFVRVLFQTANHQTAASAAAIGQGFIPTVFPGALAALALRKLEASMLKTCPSHFLSISRVVRRHG